MRSIIILLATLLLGACATGPYHDSVYAAGYGAIPDCPYGYRQGQCLSAYEAQYYHPSERFDYPRARGPQGYSPYYVYRDSIPPYRYSRRSYGSIDRNSLYYRYSGPGPNTSDGSPEGDIGRDLTYDYGRPDRSTSNGGREGDINRDLYLPGYEPDRRSSRRDRQIERRRDNRLDDRPSAGSRERARERRCPYHTSSSAARREC